MKTVADYDKNFFVETKINNDNIEFYTPLEAPYKLYGAKHDL